MKRILVLSYNDLRNIIREPMLAMMMIGPIMFSFFIHWFVPYITDILSSTFNLVPYYNLISAYIVVFTPLLLGMVSGFILLDEKDDNTWMSLVVTPLGKRGYLYYRIIMPSIFSFIYTLIILPSSSLVDVEFIYIIPIAFIAGLEAPIIALYLLIFSSNKVEGLVLSKSLGILLLAPLIKYFTNSKLSLLAGIIPFNWPIQAFIYINSSMTDYFISLFIGLVLHLILLVFMMSKFETKIG